MPSDGMSNPCEGSMEINNIGPNMHLAISYIKLYIYNFFNLSYNICFTILASE
jgi:hypothetical protein